VVVYPPILNRLLEFLLRRLKQPAFEVRMSYLRLIRLLLLYAVAWVMTGLGSAVLINAFYYPKDPGAMVPWSKLPVVIGGYALSWILGFVSLVTPAGLGVREVIYTGILETVMSPARASAASLLTRIWITVAEVIAALVFAVFLTRRRKHGQTQVTSRGPAA